MTYHDPAEQDEQFPDRPTHSDFVLLSNLIQSIDNRAEADVPIEEITGTDHDSLIYFIMNRINIMQERLGAGFPPQLKALLFSVYVDAFTIGRAFGEARTEEAIRTNTPDSPPTDF